MKSLNNSLTITWLSGKTGHVTMWPQPNMTMTRDGFTDNIFLKERKISFKKIFSRISKQRSCNYCHFSTTLSSKDNCNLFDLVILTPTE